PMATVSPESSEVTACRWFQKWSLSWWFRTWRDSRTVSERLSKEEALQRARQTGSDIFQPKWLTKIFQEQ
ncbi:hypothetical protein HPB47_012671, partial [Ixodes persulcatus]